MASHDGQGAAAAPPMLYTAGHSNRSAPELVALLRNAGVETLVDVRAVPRSRRNPQFDSEALRKALEPVGITYHWAGRQLGGRRPARAGSVHRALEEEGLRGYADYMDEPQFERAVAQLMSLARRAPTAILCAERDPMHCHRSLIADYLVLAGVRVVHLIDVGEDHEHQLRPEARRESARLVYDRNTTAELGL
jgi:uncharacterized protein (DUF488 family)